MNSQKRITDFFDAKITYNAKTQKKCFVYDPEHTCAFFCDVPNEGDHFVYKIKKFGLKCFVRNPSNEKPVEYFPSNVVVSIPLCKSNLQKAVRRNDISVALSSSMYLFQNDPIELFRRIPIIEIEDVCLMETFCVCIWLMLTHNNYQLTKKDQDNIILIVYNLCVILDCDDNNNNHNENTELINIERFYDHPNQDHLMGMFFRYHYGGMKGDQDMLKNEIVKYHNHNHQNIYRINREFSVFVPSVVKIIPEAIDFHCFPQMLNVISQKTSIDNNIIKEYIWHVESGVNFRKDHTIQNSKKYSSSDKWVLIKTFLDDYRKKLGFY
jgi:hypothetical protein